MTAEGKKVQEPQVSPAETLLYGPYASIVRRAGQAAVAMKNAAEELAEGLNASRHDDAHLASTVKTDEQGRSAHTAWIEAQWERAWGVSSEAARFYEALAADCQEKWRAARESPVVELNVALDNALNHLSIAAVEDSTTERAIDEVKERILDLRSRPTDEVSKGIGPVADGVEFQKV